MRYLSVPSRFPNASGLRVNGPRLDGVLSPQLRKPSLVKGMRLRAFEAIAAPVGPPHGYTGLSEYAPDLRSCRTIPLNAAVVPCALPISLACPEASQKVTSGQRSGQWCHKHRSASRTGTVPTRSRSATVIACRSIWTAKSTVIRCWRCIRLWNEARTNLQASRCVIEHEHGTEKPPAGRCRLCTANDQDALVEQLAADLWRTRDGQPWAEVSDQWRHVFRQFATAAIDTMRR